MNPYYRVTITLGTVATLVVSAYDKNTGTPPRWVVSNLLSSILVERPDDECDHRRDLLDDDGYPTLCA